MKKVVALQTWSNGTITMEEKSVMDIDDTLADSLIAAGICADAEDYFGTGGGGGGGGVLVVHTVTEGADVRLDKTYKEIADAIFSVLDIEEDGLHTIIPVNGFAFEEGDGGDILYGEDVYSCSAENEYPILKK